MRHAPGKFFWMNASKRPLLFLTAILFAGTLNHILAQADTISIDIKCFKVIAEYKSFWDRDSSGVTGFRLLVGEKFLEKCTLSGIKWSELSHLLGNPSRIIHEGNSTSIYYDYILFMDHDGNWGSPGTAYLTIEVRDGWVVSNKVVHVDG